MTQPANDVLTNLIVGFLVPMFIAAAGDDPALARQAAIQTINAYQAQTRPDILSIARIVAFGLAALDALSRSMDDTLPPALALRLRANAVACNRAADAANRALTPPRHRRPPNTHPTAAPRETDNDRTIWANAMADVAAEVAATLPNLTQAQHRAATTQIAALQSVAANLHAAESSRFPTRTNPR